MALVKKVTNLAEMVTDKAVLNMLRKAGKLIYSGVGHGW